MRVALLIDRWQPSRGGAERALAQLAAHLAGRGLDVLAVGRAGHADPRAPGRFVGVRAGGWTRGARERRLAAALLAAAEREASDVTVGVRHLPRADVYWPHGGCHRETLARLGKPLRGRHRAFVELEDELLASGSGRVLCVSRLVRDEYARHYPAAAGRLVLAPNGVDLERYHPRERDGARARLDRELGDPVRPLLVFAGQDPRRKGLDLLLSALAGLGDLSWTLCVAGPRRAGPWRRAARSAGLGGRVFFRPRLPSLDLAAGADLAVLPARREPCGLVLLEALACGTPVVTSRAAGAAEAVGSDEAGAAVDDPADAGALGAVLRARIERLAAGPPDRDGVRRGVLGRGLSGWLAALEAEVRAAAAAR